MLSETQLQFVTLADQFYQIHGTLMSPAEALDTYAMPKEHFLKLLNDADVQAALKERGIPVGLVKNGVAIPEKDLWKHAVLTPEKLQAANIMLDLIDTRSQKKKLQDLNITTSTWARWLKDPAMQSYLRARTESMMKDNDHEAHLALLDKVRQGDIKAIEFYYEMTGQYTRASARGGNSTAVDVQNLLVRIIEIIEDEVHDPATQVRIGERLRSLGSARTIAGEIVGDTSHAESVTIAKSRELSPELMALMKSGEGFE